RAREALVALVVVGVGAFGQLFVAGERRVLRIFQQRKLRVVVPEVGGIVAMGDSLAVVAEPAIDALLRGAAVAVRTAESPLAEAAGGVAELLKESRQRDSSGFERMLAFGLDLAIVSHLSMARVQAGHQDATRRSADRVGRVALCPSHSGLGELVAGGW